jgi:D-alanine--poly(phosphoribitol) ligase subunit 1
MSKNFFFLELKRLSNSKGTSVALVIEKKEYTFTDLFNDCIKFSIELKKKKIFQLAFEANYKYESYVILLSCLITDVTYIPINILNPKKRIKKILDNNNIQSKVLIKNKKYVIDILYTKKNSTKKIKQRENLIAYIIFTSGSTGDPKGVMIKQKSLIYYTKYLQKLFKEKKRSFLQLSSLGFDLSVVDFFGSIFTGSKLYVPNKYQRFFPAKFIKENKITNLVCVPSLINSIDAAKQLTNNNFKSLESIFFCGEALYPTQLKKIFAINPKIKIINTYGPTEATVSCTQLNLNKSNYLKYSYRNIAIGKHIAGTKIKFLKLNKKNLYELYISGIQIFKGYFNDYKETHKKICFINNEFFFKTGDIVEKYNNNYFFKYRKDSQIKISGYRVDLEEINYTLSKIIGTRVATIIKKKKIISYCEHAKQSKKNLDHIFKSISKLIPKYMIPNKINFIKNLPLNNNGKIDFKILTKKAL